MDEFEIEQLFQAAADEAVEAGWSDDRIKEAVEQAIERAREA